MLAELLALTLLTPAADKPPLVGKEVPVINQWSGRTTLEKAKLAPKDKFLTGPEQLARLWKEWRVKGEPPAVDFKKTAVLVVAAGGSKLKAVPILTDKGNLIARVEATTDITPDIGYSILAVSARGVKTVHGKPYAP